MNPETIIRAWKDPEFRARLTSEQLHTLPENPSGRPMTELGEDDLEDVVGGGVPVITRPTVFTTRPPTLTILTTRGSAVDACPSALGCTTTLTIRQTTIAELG
ncbi:mersacidin/lichenicidin family type 2 lantibiotic [Archangium violaceum]|uniref:mersacidin/lichenicidin family type 2 lantibiotic n=1 Tax=Archangium violaceum TaxID=83451 RepID=UPI001950401A|nr:mersacidin/lichenicidin family type 2 lantibiotic [Archangium violaceum]QRN92816.1 mersacidin/lichenicidin family type 2 lantibiotic [Archangium violaceum]